MTALAAARGIIRPGGGGSIRAARPGATAPNLSSLLPALPDWHADPRLPCRADPNAWFAEDKTGAQKAAAICRARCPRLAECAAQALDDLERYGVWGGMTQADRIDATRDSGDTRRRRGGRPRTGPTCGHPPAGFRRRGNGSTWCTRCDRAQAAKRRGCPTGPTTAEQIDQAADRRERVMSAYHALAPRELEHSEAAAALGLSPGAFKSIYSRARRDGDPRAVRHTSASKTARAGALAGVRARRRAA